MGSMYRVQFYCPRQAPIWQDLTESVLILFRSPKTFPSLPDAQRAANALIWQFHSARVIDPYGQVVYQV